VKIALIHKRLDLRGGTERVFFRTAEGLRDRGHEVHIFCGSYLLPPPEGTFAHRVPHFTFPRTAALLSFAVMAPRTAERHGCDVVLSFNRILRQDIFRSGGGPHRAFLRKMMLESGPWRRLWYRLSLYHRSMLAVEKRQLSARGCRKVITVSAQGKREMIEYYQIPEDKVVIVHNGVDHTRFHPELRHTEGKKVRQQLGIPEDSRVVLFVGTGFKRKGLERLLPLWRLPEFKDVYLLVVGNDTRLRYYRRCFDQPTVLFLGARENVESYYAAADLFVLPSTQEAFGNAVLEALAAGLPVVTVPEVGATDKIDGVLKEGMLVDRNNPAEIKQKILRMLNKDGWHLLSAAARRVSEQYSWDNYFRQLEQQLRTVAACRAKEG
jgi:UDP-glucose:(heptosyl)LPS alpha-1,3-glucosyltransferase